MDRTFGFGPKDRGSNPRAPMGKQGFEALGLL